MRAADVRREVVEASRILAGEGLLDAYGHVSARSPDQSDRFFMSRALAPALVEEADVLEHDLDGEVASDPGIHLFLERFIHAEIYRSRADVQAVVHSHSPAVLPFAVSPSVPARPIIHMCGHMRSMPQPFDVADHAGPATDLLIRDPALGAALADHLGDATVVLMRGHGFTAIGKSVSLATYHAIYTAKNCEVQRAALALGEPVYLSAGEAVTCDRSTEGEASRAWDLWRHTHCAAVDARKPVRDDPRQAG